ncbi:radical SAM protein [Bacteroidota bacterium]
MHQQRRLLYGQKLERILEGIIGAYAFPHYKLTKGYAFYPMHVMMDITLRCNLRCHGCYKDTSKRKEKDPIDTAGWKHIIDQLPPWTLLMLTGGEPTLRKDFRDLARHAFRKHWCHLNTNGTIIDDDLARFIIGGRFFSVGVSIDGDRQTHDNVRGVKGAFDKAWYGLERLIYYRKKMKRKWPLIDVKTVIWPNTLKGVSRLIDLVAQSGANLITISFPRISSFHFSSQLVNELSPLYQKVEGPERLFDVNELIGLCSQWEDKLYGNGVAWRYYPRMLSHKQFGNYIKEDSFANRYLPCHVPWVFFGINHDGDVYPCLSYRYGNILKQGLKEILNSERAIKFRSRIKESVLFPQCEGCCFLRVRPS